MSQQAPIQNSEENQVLPPEPEATQSAPAAGAEVAAEPATELPASEANSEANTGSNPGANTGANTQANAAVEVAAELNAAIETGTNAEANTEKNAVATTDAEATTEKKAVATPEKTKPRPSVAPRATATSTATPKPARPATPPKPAQGSGGNGNKPPSKPAGGSSGSGGDSLDDSSMTLMEHLQELRVRLMWIAGAMIVGTLISMAFAEFIIGFITSPINAYADRLIAIGPTDTIGIFFKVSLTTGAAIAMPVIIYQIIAFVSPGLYPHERRALLLILPGIMVLFVIGAAFAYFLLMPAAIGFLQGFLSGVIRQEWTIDRYIGFVTRVVFWIGVAFETPLVVAFLARIGLLTGPSLLKMWRHAIVIAAIVAAAITPTIDPVNMTIVMGPLIMLYFFSVGVAYVLYRPREPRDFSKEPFIKE